MLVGYDKLNKLIKASNEIIKVDKMNIVDEKKNEIATLNNDSCSQIFSDFTNKKIDSKGLVKRYRNLNFVSNLDTETLIMCLAMFAEDYVNNYQYKWRR